MRTRVLLVVLVTSIGTARAEPSDTVQMSEYDSHACLDPDGAVGYRNCPRFGAWGAALESPYITLSIGVTMRMLPRSLTVSGASSVAARTVTSPQTAERDRSFEYTERVAIAFAGPLFAGAEVDIGLSDSRKRPVGARTPAASGYGLAGLHIGLGPIALDGELAGGARLVEITTDGPSALQVEPIAEARARAGLWLSPWITLGGVVGTSLLDRSEWTAGLYFGVHSWAFGGR